MDNDNGLALSSASRQADSAPVRAKHVCESALELFTMGGEWRWSVEFKCACGLKIDVEIGSPDQQSEARRIGRAAFELHAVRANEGA